MVIFVLITNNVDSILQEKKIKFPKNGILLEFFFGCEDTPQQTMSSLRYLGSP
jgi:hypothetical protein